MNSKWYESPLYVAPTPGGKKFRPFWGSLGVWICGVLGDTYHYHQGILKNPGILDLWITWPLMAFISILCIKSLTNKEWGHFLCMMGYALYLYKKWSYFYFIFLLLCLEISSMLEKTVIKIKCFKWENLKVTPLLKCNRVYIIYWKWPYLIQIFISKAWSWMQPFVALILFQGLKVRQWKRIRQLFI